MSIQRLSITQPDDWHLHLRDGEALALTVPHAAKQFARAIIMPNLVPPVIDCDMAEVYRQRILQYRPQESNFTPLMTLYLTDQCHADLITQVHENPYIYAFKLYPANATTNSAAGINNLQNLYPMFELLAQYHIPLLIHGEVTDKDIDIFDREQQFIDQHLSPIRDKFPSLKIVLEHITTKYAVDFIKAQTSHTAATITAHHLLYNRNDLLVGGIKPHYYCLPILKRHRDQAALVQAAISGDPRFFFGSDSAPHPKSHKESACGCAGIYTAHAAMGLLTEVFEAENALDKLEAFCSHYGADFYQLPRNQDKINLVKKPWQVPASYPFQGDQVIPLRANSEVQWQLDVNQHE